VTIRWTATGKRTRFAQMARLAKRNPYVSEFCTMRRNGQNEAVAFLKKSSAKNFCS
jgi:hypothetical protein